MERLYKVYFNEDGETYEAIYPESGLPEIGDIEEVELLGMLAEGYVILEEDDEDDDPEKEPLPLLKSVNA